MPRIHLLEPAAHERTPLPRGTVRVLGIDLGTTNSTICDAIFDPDEPEIDIPGEIVIEQDCFGEIVAGALVPSVVAVVNDRAVVGHAAARMRTAPAELNLEEQASIFYETKNDIGLGKVYFKAPPGFRSPAEIGGHILGALHCEATVAGGAARVVVTVPASFQTAQRAETIRAAELAGLHLEPGDLLDEPVAVFIDKFVSEDGEPFVSRGGRVLVFDFGGGTCDVAIFQVVAPPRCRPRITPLSVSRYHRLGGGDIDRAIVYQALVPQLEEQNGLSPHTLTFDDKRNHAEPALLAVAEALKVELTSTSDATSATIHKTVRIPLEDRELRLKNPTLTLEEFESLLDPFLERDPLFGSNSEYRVELSIFAPIWDAFDRTGLSADDIDFVMLAGGSTLIPQVVSAIRDAFPRATVIRYDDAMSVQTAVARGAAYHALSLALFGEGIVRPVTLESISLRTSSGLAEVIPKGVDLPYPKEGGWSRPCVLAVPAARAHGPVEMRIEVVSGVDSTLLDVRYWDMPPSCTAGQPLRVESRLDENRQLHLRVSTDDDAQEPLAVRIENPITHVVNPGEVRLRIEQTERQLESESVPASEIVSRLTTLGSDYAEIGHREKALDRYRRALRKLGRPSGWILFKMGLVAGDLGDKESQEKFYLQAAEADTAMSSPLFNLALSKFRQDLLDVARVHVNAAIDRSPEGPYYALKASIANAAGDQATRDRALERAFHEFAPVTTLDSFELHWFEAAAVLKGDAGLVDRAKEVRRALSQRKGIGIVERGVLPDCLASA
ncbi:MAG: Hsp70 family protein [Blastocatellia bacterium]|nr:Hsp70 family protein [Blastocatellia bacterium]